MSIGELKNPLAEPRQPEFFVGYLKMPERLKAFLRWVVPCILVAGIAFAWSLSRSQADPGDGVWHDKSESLVGRIAGRPYPMIRILSNRPTAAIETVLLVSEGKHGGGERVQALDGRIAKVRGTILERDGRRLLELEDGEDSVVAASLPAAEQERLAGDTNGSGGGDAVRVTLAGEIIDPKCYSGAMKPGEGKAHKECATLCIAGGIPPMFVTVDHAGERSYFLLTDAAGNPLVGRVLHDQVLPFVADAVELSGTLETRDDVVLLRLDPASIRRL